MVSTLQVVVQKQPHTVCKQMDTAYLPGNTIYQNRPELAPSNSLPIPTLDQSYPVEI